MVVSTLEAGRLVTCSLCGLSTLHPLSDRAGALFCCTACREVAALLADSPPSALAEGALAAADAASIQISLSGLWCASCGWLVEEQLKRTPGVIEAQVSFIKKQARLVYDQARLTPQKLKQRIKLLGYRAWLADEKPYDEEDAFLTRLLIGGVLVMHDMLVSFSLYAREWLGFASPETEWLADFFRLMMLLTSIPLLVLFGLPILRAGLASLLRGQPNTHTLIALGTFAAWGLSLHNFLQGTGQVYFDTTSMLLFLVTIGRWLEMQAHKAGGEAVDRLRQQIPQTAWLLTPEGAQEIPVDELRPGARLRVRPGEHFPVDGILAAGSGDVDESILTGEARPVPHQVGDVVRAGTINLDGVFEVVASAVGEKTQAGQIGRLLHQALWQRSPVERLADRLAAWMTPVALALAGLAFVFWNARLGPQAGLMTALSVLLIACPCALGLATPLTLWLALSRAAESGVILRSSSTLERLGRVDAVYFDKTGTLTRLPMSLRQIACEAGPGPDARAALLRRLAAAERGSEHPVARAITSAADEAEVDPLPVDDFRALPGSGVYARVGGEPTWVGNRRLMDLNACKIPAEMEDQAGEWRAQGLVVVYAGWNGQVRGLVGLGETVRSEAPQALQALQQRGLQLSVLTGDDRQSGRRWQASLGIPVHAGLQPGDKIDHLRRAVHSTVMVGDGLNDGPALATATVGVSFSHGTDVAQMASEVVLVRDDLRLLPWLVDLSRQAMRRVRQNLAWAFIYNLIGLLLAMSGLLTPLLSALAMVISSLLVTFNALRLRKTPLFQGSEAGS